MVDQFKTILEAIQDQKGRVNLFAILKMDEITDKWTVLLSAPWITEQTLKDDFILLRNLMMHNFDGDEMATVAKLIVATKDEHIVEELLKFKVGSEICGDQKINGNIVHEAYIIASDSSL